MEGEVKWPEVVTGAEQRSSGFSGILTLGEVLPSCGVWTPWGLQFKGWSTFWELRLTSDLSIGRAVVLGSSTLLPHPQRGAQVSSPGCGLS